MNKYVVAFWSDHTGQLLQEEVEAISRVEAAKKYLNVDFSFETFEDVIEYCVNCDAMISVIRIDKKNWKNFTTQGPDHVAPAFH